MADRSMNNFGILDSENVNNNSFNNGKQTPSYSNANYGIIGSRNIQGNNFNNTTENTFTSSKEQVDVVVQTALKLEMDKAIQYFSSNGFNISQYGEYFKGTGFINNKHFSIIFACSYDMNSVNAAKLASVVRSVFDVKLFCMIGICAVKEGKLKMFDVVIPDQIQFAGTGKQTDNGLQHTQETVRLKDKLRIVANRMNQNTFVERIMKFLNKQYIPTYTTFHVSILARLLNYKTEGEEFIDFCFNKFREYRTYLTRMKNNGLISGTFGSTLDIECTEKGKQYFEEVLQNTDNEIEYFSNPNFMIVAEKQVAQTTNFVAANSDPFGGATDRRTSVIDMEGYGFSKVLEEKDFLFAKCGVDYGNEEKDDKIQEDACTVAAVFLYMFLEGWN
ncbi:hypothetical protein ABK040_008673 [Willaertia magna]